MFVSSKYLYIDSCMFKKGFGFKGGAIFWSVMDIGYSEIINSVFDSNIAYSIGDFDSYGGCIYFEGLESFGYDVRIRDTSFTNSTSNNKGGVFYIHHFGSKMHLDI